MINSILVIHSSRRISKYELNMRTKMVCKKRTFVHFDVEKSSQIEYNVYIKL